VVVLVMLVGIPLGPHHRNQQAHQSQDRENRTHQDKGDRDAPMLHPPVGGESIPPRAWLVSVARNAYRNF
jgi:hypothetical protein